MVHSTVCTVVRACPGRPESAGLASEPYSCGKPSIAAIAAALRYYQIVFNLVEYRSPTNYTCTPQHQCRLTEHQHSSARIGWGTDLAHGRHRREAADLPPADL
jgi:hypothetical protein